MASKVIITGSVQGQFPAVFEKLSKLHAKNHFSLAIVLGDLFADPTETSSEDKENVQALLSGKIPVPLPIYFTLGKYALPLHISQKLGNSNDEVCPNLYFLGKRSTTKTSEGLRIVNLGGSLDPAITAGLSKDRFLPFHTEGDAHTLRGANTADILLTTHWPLSIRTGSHVAIPDEAKLPPAEKCVADLCAALKPRYHFSTSAQTFYEREPFFHTSLTGQPDTGSVTRFISLGAYNNPAEQKWLYAFSIDPTASQPINLPPRTTASPLTSSKKRPHPSQEAAYSRFSTTTHLPPSKRARLPPPTPQECFFCLSNPNLATHLVASIGSESYLTTAKGPLTTPTKFPKLACPAHILIIPLAHTPTLSAIPDPASRTATLREMHRYRRALQSYVHARSIHLGISPDATAATTEPLGAITWSVSRASGVHVHWQFLPVPASLVHNGLVEAAFRVEADNLHYPTFAPALSPPSARTAPDTNEKTPKEEEQEEEDTRDFFRVWIWAPPSPSPSPSPSATPRPPSTGTHTLTLTLPLLPHLRFDVQFGRRVMAKLLGLEARLQWRDCAQEVCEEEADVAAFKAGFAGWDFSSA